MRQGSRVEAGALDARIVVDDLATLTGAVAFADGTAPAEITVKLGGATSRSFPGARFRIDGVPAGTQFVVIDGPELVEKVRADVQIAAEGITDLGTLTVERGRRISGTVVDAGGRPVAGATVVAALRLDADGTSLAPTGRGEQAVTGGDGRFAMRGVGPALDLVLIADHDTVGRSDAQKIPAGAGDVEATLTVRPTGVVEGFIRIDGQPAGAFVTLMPANAPEASFGVDTGPDGSYRFDRIGAGHYLLYAGISRGTLAGGESGGSRSVDVASGKITTADLDLVGAGIAVTIHMRSPGDVADFGFGAILSAAPDATFEVPRTIGDVRNLLMVVGSAAAREGLILEHRAIEFAHVLPGRNIACALALPGDPNDPAIGAQIELMSLDTPAYCKDLVIAPSPDHQDITIDVQPFSEGEAP
jgi:hypothetical protein